MLFGSQYFLWGTFKTTFRWEIKLFCPVCRVRSWRWKELRKLVHWLTAKCSAIANYMAVAPPPYSTSFFSGYTEFLSWLRAQELLWAWPVLLTQHVASIGNDSRWNEPIFFGWQRYWFIVRPGISLVITQVFLFHLKNHSRWLNNAQMWPSFRFSHPTMLKGSKKFTK